MANYTAADVKRLREQTGAGMMDCKNALVEADGDYEAAVELLRIKGAKDVTKRAQRTAGNGLVTSQLAGTGSGVLLELNCETDFVAKTDLFQQVASDLDKSSPDLPPTLGVLVQLDEAGAALGQDIAHQVAAMRPQYVTRDQVPDDVLASERRIAEQVTREEGKPEKAIPMIVEGRLNDFLKDIVLIEQASVRDQKKTVKQLLSEQGASVKEFARFQIGQAG